jgi:hypothetical protein
MKKSYAWVLLMVVVLLVGSVVASQSAIAEEAKANAPEAEGSVTPLVTPVCFTNGKASAYAGGSSHTVFCSKGFSSETHLATGIWCFTLAAPIGASYQPTALATVEWGASLGVVLFAQWNNFNTNCGGTSHSTIEVRTYKGDIGGVGSGYQIPVLSDSVAFTVLVP